MEIMQLTPFICTEQESYRPVCGSYCATITFRPISPSPALVERVKRCATTVTMDLA
jgi:hypothetical protein